MPTGSALAGGSDGGGTIGGGSIIVEVSEADSTGAGILGLRRLEAGMPTVPTARRIQSWHGSRTICP